MSVQTKLNKQKQHLYFYLGWLVIILNFFSAFALAETKSDKPLVDDLEQFEIFIDISGSMKTNDPKHLRLSALDMFIQLLPEKKTASLWTFGDTTQALVELGAIDSAWKNKALAARSKIQANNAWTALDQVFQAALNEKKHLSADRHLMLLTDGFLDISKDPEINLKAKQKLITQILPQLKKEKIKVYAIALSKNADRALLKAIADTTGGYFWIAEDASELQEKFLSMFDQAQPLDQVPLKRNMFAIDESVQEFTALFFRDKNTPGHIVNPQGQLYSPNNKPDNVRWYSAENFDLVTVNKPMPGKWHLLGDEQPLNRVSILSDLKLRAENLPEHLLKNERLEIKLSVVDGNKIIKNLDLLSVLDLEFIQTWLSASNNKKSDGKTKQTQTWSGYLTAYTQNQVRHPKNGSYDIRLGKTLVAGEHEFEFILESPTFQRKIKRRVMIHSRLFNAVTMQAQKTNYTEKVLSFIPIANLIAENSPIILTASIIDPENQFRLEPIVKNKEGLWVLPVTPTLGGGTYQVELIVDATLNTGEKVKFKHPSISIIYDEKTPVVPLVQTIKNDLPEKVELEHTNKDALNDLLHKIPGKEFKIAGIIFINLFVLLIFGLIYRRWLKPKAQKNIQFDQDLQNQLNQILGQDVIEQLAKKSGIARDVLVQKPVETSKKEKPAKPKKSKSSFFKKKDKQLSSKKEPTVSSDDAEFKE